jgi:hypothetical protein
MYQNTLVFVTYSHVYYSKKQGQEPTFRTPWGPCLQTLTEVETTENDTPAYYESE